ncbi:MAG: DUF6638 family protein [Shimia sp.]
MRRLIEKGLAFGNLIPVDTPVLVERYNRALHHLTGKRTALTEFHIDIAGYSPEVGVELGDPLYLNPRGVNRQFILLTLDQRTAPLLDAKFSTGREVLRRWMAANHAQLFTLTARDAVAGELLNSVYDLSTPQRLLDIHRIEVEADTTAGTIATAQALGAKIDRFMSEPEAWYDDVLIAEMIGLAKDTGDVIRNPIALEQTVFEPANFWSAHFGGVYVFRGVAEPAVLVADEALVGAFDLRTIALDDAAAVAAFLHENTLAEPLVKARGIDVAAILQQKMDFLLISHAASAGAVPEHRDRRRLRVFARDLAPDLPAAWHDLAALHRWATQGGGWPKIAATDAAYFYALRAADTPHADLVNRLLAELTPDDARQLFICHKELFYDRYADWPEAKQTFVAEMLAAEYAVDKAGARAALYGHEPEMSPPPPPPPGPWEGRDLVERVGPWGAVRR